MARVKRGGLSGSAAIAQWLPRKKRVPPPALEGLHLLDRFRPMFRHLRRRPQPAQNLFDIGARFLFHRLMNMRFDFSHDLGDSRVQIGVTFLRWRCSRGANAGMAWPYSPRIKGL